MPHQYDAIIIGAVYNGLTCACYLARAGLKVLVLEQYHTVGGMTVTEEETLPGFWSDIHASGYQLANLSPVPNELGLLDRYELIEPEIPFSHAFPNGDLISVHRDIEKTAAEIARLFGEGRRDVACAYAPVSRTKGCDHRGDVFTAASVSGSGSGICRLAGWHGSLSLQHAERQIVGGPDAGIRGNEDTVRLFRHVFRRLARRCWRRTARLAFCLGPAKRRQQPGQRRNASRHARNG